jgi:aldehyde:ferredoxin oxidoreductase
MGMDTISCGMSIACAMEMFERGLIPESDIGFPLRFGDAENMVKLVEMTAKREGFGDLLAEGSYRMAEKYGTTEYFMGVKKQEFASYDGRGIQGMALGFATQPRGACHIRGEIMTVDLFEINNWRMLRDRGISVVDPLRWDDKHWICMEIQDLYCMIDAAGMCNFLTAFGLDEDDVRAFIESATGIDMGGYEGFMRTGERIFNLETLFNRRAGITGADDTLPRRMTEEPLPEGHCQGMVAHLSEMLPEYYKVRGWGANGNLTGQRAEELGLGPDLPNVGAGTKKPTGGKGKQE